MEWWQLAIIIAVSTIAFAVVTSIVVGTIGYFKVTREITKDESPSSHYCRRNRP